MKKIIFIMIFIFSTIVLSGCSSTIDGEKSLDNKKWIQDIEYLDKNIRLKHPDLFRYISEEEWKISLKKLKSDVVKLSDVSISLRIAQIISQIKDAHTSTDVLNLLTPIGKEKIEIEEVIEFPIKFEYFKDGLRVIECDSQYKDILGYKLLSINNVPTDEVIKKVSTLNSYDNEQFAKLRAKKCMSIYEFLKFLQIVDGDETQYVFENENKEKTNIKVKAIKNKEVNYVNLEKKESEISEKSEQKNDFYWFKEFEKDNILYFKYNRILTKQGPNIDKENAHNYPDYYEFERNLIDKINNDKFDKIVIDLRNNRGGAFALVDSLISKLKYRTYLNDKDIIVIQGKETASAGAILSWRLQNKLDATVIGEESGGNVNMFGTEGEFITLPNSKLIIKYPYSDVTCKDGHVGGVKPDVKIIQTYENYINGIDDCYEFIKNLN
ncbi:S41 family peptidase [Romboutsia sedimentorum]|uniref:S41 family peptidase n=1 Tax=Romboutsia sedimentorum TaxID=1368474 RepID=A0ABT7E679_9FIRM|nr:S41 family peptidase [Romboutsia sedimentorum]MDK2562440.1 S41 family peptidase [Romboutsia sedimentorum]